MNSLYLNRISKSFGKTEVLKNISLELYEDELLVVLGPSGCGKSTMLRLIAGLEDLSSGEIYLHDKRIDKLEPKDRNVAMVFQNYSLYPHMTVEKNLGFPLKIAKEKKNIIKEKVTEAAEMLGLTDKLQSKPSELSGGQRQRVALGRAIIRKPDIFLLDEPLSNLDADLRLRMRMEIVRIQQELKTTTIHVTHDQAEALSMADRILLLNNGEIVQLGTPEELYKKPNSVFTAQFIGFPKMNIIEAAIDNKYLMPFGILVESFHIEEGNELQIGIRPEDVSLQHDGQYQAKVTASEYFGEQYIITLDYNGVELKVSGCQKPKKIDEMVTFSVNESSMHFFNKQTGLRIE